MKAMLESIPEGQNPNGYFTKERFASVMNATLPSLGSRDDRAQLESLFDQIDTGKLPCEAGARAERHMSA